MPNCSEMMPETFTYFSHPVFEKLHSTSIHDSYFKRVRKNQSFELQNKQWFSAIY